MSPQAKPKLAIDDILKRLNYISNTNEKLTDFELGSLKREAKKFSESADAVVSIHGFMYFGMLAVINNNYKETKDYFNTARNHATYRAPEIVEDVDRNYIRSLFKLGRFTEAYSCVEKYNYTLKYPHELDSFISIGYYSGHFKQTLKWLDMGFKQAAEFADRLPVWKGMQEVCKHFSNYIENEQALVDYYSLIEEFLIDRNLRFNMFDVFIHDRELWMDIELKDVKDTFEVEKDLFSFLATKDVNSDVTTSIYWGIYQG